MATAHSYTDFANADRLALHGDFAKMPAGYWPLRTQAGLTLIRSSKSHAP